MIEFLWLGQAGYIVETDTVRIVIDPYLSNAVEKREGHARLIPPPIKLGDLDPEYLLITHDHLDHYDPDAVPQIMGHFPDCVLVGPESVIAHAINDGIPKERLRRLNKGEVLNLKRVELTAVPTRHSDPWGIGLLIQSPDTLVYMSGDTEFYPELINEIRQSADRKIDIGFVVVNGRWGNMNCDEAADLLAGIEAGLCIPTHYGMFDANTIDPENFIRIGREKGLCVRLLCPGEVFCGP